MAKVLDKIVVSTAPPNSNALWLDGEKLKALVRGKWKNIGGGTGNPSEDNDYYVPLRLMDAEEAVEMTSEEVAQYLKYVNNPNKGNVIVDLEEESVGMRIRMIASYVAMSWSGEGLMAYFAMFSGSYIMTYQLLVEKVEGKYMGYVDTQFKSLS